MYLLFTSTFSSSFQEHTSQFINRISEMMGTITLWILLSHRISLFQIMCIGNSVCLLQLNFLFLWSWWILLFLLWAKQSIETWTMQWERIILKLIDWSYILKVIYASFCLFYAKEIISIMIRENIFIGSLINKLKSRKDNKND